MWRNTPRLALVVVLACYGLDAGTRAEADLIISTPAGLTAGDTFRIVFVADGTITATSTNISTYNNFVTQDASNQAGGGNVIYDGTILTWSAIASTSSISAINNIGVTGAPVYLANGTLIATSDSTSSGGLWSGTLQNPIEADLNNNQIWTTGETNVWTGTNPEGSVGAQGGLGTPDPTFGIDTETDSIWATYEGFYAEASLNLYGISQELTVPAATSTSPEPSTAVLALLGTSALLAFRWCRSRRDERLQRQVDATVVTK